MSYFFLIQIFKHLPWFHWLVVEPFYHNGLRFESDKHIGNVTCPIMILHAEDDNIIPLYLGEKVCLNIILEMICVLEVFKNIY